MLALFCNGNPVVATKPENSNSQYDSVPPSEKYVIAILWAYANRMPVYQAWLQQVPASIEVRILEDYQASTVLDDDIDLLITHMHYRWDELSILRSAMQQQKVGVLVLVDGILEFRNTWQNPNLPAASLMQPALAHKIATIGPAQARVLESWGNAGKCEVVGLPALDPVLLRNHWWDANNLNDLGALPVTANPPISNATKTILVCSARTPAFDEAQWQVSIQQFQDLKQFFHAKQHPVSGQTIRVVWRLADRLHQELNIPGPSETEPVLADLIASADALITSPSTIQLEAMAHRKPVALLDYFGVPHYVNAAWEIKHTDHIAPVVTELIDPPTPRLLFQAHEARQQLWTHNSSTKRMWELIVTMAMHARENRKQHRDQTFPEAILSSDLAGYSPTQNHTAATHAQNAHAEIVGLQQTVDSSPSDLSHLWEMVEVQAAIKRARELSEDRAQVVQSFQTNAELRKHYSNSLEAKSEVIHQQVDQIADLRFKLASISQLLEQRNTEFAVLQEKVAKISTERINDHKMLSESHADAKAKQERVNELRGRVEELRKQNESLRQAPAKLDNLSTQQKQLQQRYEEGVDERRILYAEIKQLRIQRDTLNQQLNLETPSTPSPSWKERYDQAEAEIQALVQHRYQLNQQSSPKPDAPRMAEG